VPHRRPAGGPQPRADRRPRRDAGELDAILGDLVEHGAAPVNPEDARVEPADIAGAFPEGFYSTTNQRTQVRLAGRLGRRWPTRRWTAGIQRGRAARRRGAWAMTDR
jgi:hypothetical protein